MKIRLSSPIDLSNINKLEQDNYGYILTTELVNDSLHTYFVLEDNDIFGYIYSFISSYLLYNSSK